MENPTIKVLLPKHPKYAYCETIIAIDGKIAVVYKAAIVIEKRPYLELHIPLDQVELGMLPDFKDISTGKGSPT